MGEVEDRGTHDNPVIVDVASTALYYELNHVHDTEGNCVKNRFAVRCDPPLPRGDYREAIKTVVGMARRIVELEGRVMAAQQRASSYKTELIEAQDELARLRKRLGEEAPDADATAE